MVFKNNIKFHNLTNTIYNVYLSIFDKPEYDNKIIIEGSKAVDKNLCINKECVLYNHNSYMFSIFNIPIQYKEDLYLIISGKYSELSDNYKHKVLYFWNEDKDSRLFGILYKNKKSRFTENEYLINKKKIDDSYEYCSKPLYQELIYGLHE